MISIFATNKMSSPNSPTLGEVIENIVEDVLHEKAEQLENQEIAPKEVREETEEVKVEVGEALVFFIEKKDKVFPKNLAKKGFMEEIVSSFKEEIEKRGWEAVCKHLEPRRRALVKKFYINLGEKRNLTCYVRGRWVPFGERAIS